MKIEYIIIIVLILIIICLLLSKKNNTQVKSKIISAKSHEELMQKLEEEMQKGQANSNSTILTSFDMTTLKDENIINQLQQSNLPPEVINYILNKSSQNGVHTKTTNQKTIHYMNGQKVKETSNTTTQTLTPFTNCPNCGAEINTKNPDKCTYCNTVLSNYIQKQE